MWRVVRLRPEIMSCEKYDDLLLRQDTVFLDFFSLISGTYKPNYYSVSFTESYHLPCLRSAVTLLFATFQPARLHNDRFVQSLYSYEILFKLGQKEPLYSNTSYWLLRVKFQMNNGCSLQMLNGNVEMRSGST